MIKKTCTFIIFAFLIFSIFTVFFPIGKCEETSGNTLYVGGTGTGNYSKIQDAIDVSNEGDTIYVYSGIYYEFVVWVDKSIDLVGENRDTTIIDGTGGDVVHIGADWVNITGFTIQNGSDRGIDIYSLNNTIAGNTIKSNGCGININLGWAFYSNITGYSTISGNIITHNNEDGICLRDVSNVIITENNITNNNNGISIQGFSYSATISNNTLTSNGDCGIKVTTGSRNNIFGNTIVNNKDGLDLIMSYYNTISDNIIKDNNDCSINLSGSNFNTIQKNNITNTKNNGISLTASSYCDIFDNIISNSANYGIYLFFALNNTIADNIIKENGYGMYIKNFSVMFENLSGYENLSKIIDTNNIIHHNKFIDNEHNAYDEYNNIWDNGYPSGGNYWDDYTGEDTNDDGIGETPYDIPGGENKDFYPLGYFKKEGNESKTPGLELIIAICAIALVLFWKKKRI